jgi:hypothetical protein
MFNRRGHREMEQRRAERLDRADAAGKLHARVPHLRSLKIEIREHSQSMTETTYVRRFVIDHAAALVDVPCSDTRCTGGGYDLTAEVLRALDGRVERLVGDRTCGGQCRIGGCSRELRFEAIATYAPKEAVAAAQ